MPAESMRVGVMIVVRHPSEDLVMAFERMDVPGAWQLPQGGVDVGEKPLDAAWRELGEETRLSSAEVEFVSATENWIGYRYPPEFPPKGKHIGQCHQWYTFVARSPDVEPTPDQHEFGAWRWISPDELIDIVVEFRRPSYRLGLGRQ